MESVSVPAEERLNAVPETESSFDSATHHDMAERTPLLRGVTSDTLQSTDVTYSQRPSPYPYDRVHLSAESHLRKINA